MKPSNLLKIETLNDEWLDKDMVILHACFQILSDCIEKENLFTGHVDWTYDDEHKNAKNEIEDLYNWWNKRKVCNYNSEDFQYEEDNQMLKKLIEFRQYLWT